MNPITATGIEEPGRYAPCAFVVTTLNEQENIGRLLESVSRQTRLPSEVVIVDAGSKDRTLDIISEAAKSIPKLRLLVYAEPGTIAHCRNFGIMKTRFAWIPSTDADCELDAHFVEAMCRGLESHDVVGGTYRAEPQTFAERLFQALQSITWDNVDDLYVYPSMAIGFRKSAYEIVGGYNETLEASEDLDLCLRLRRTAGLSFCLCKDAKLTHYVGRGFRVPVRIAYRDIEGNVAFGLAGRGTPHWKILLASVLLPTLVFALLIEANWLLLGVMLVVAGYAVIVYSKIEKEIRGHGFGLLVVLTDLLTRLVQAFAMYAGIARWVKRKIAPSRLKHRHKLG